MQGVDKNGVRPRKLPQFVASLSATIGVFAAGLVFGWTSSAGENGKNLRYSFEIDSREFSWVSSVFHFGGATICIPASFLTNLVGRKMVMLILTVPFTIGWVLVIWPNSVAMLIAGRFVLGMSSGAFLVTVPTYIAEIADKETRGKLCSYITIYFHGGILVAYMLGLLHDMYLQSLISWTLPIVFLTFIFMPESATYYLMKGNTEAARKTLIWLRGTHYDVESELKEKTDGLEEDERNRRAFFFAIKTPAVWKTLLIGYCLVIFQSFSGSDAILSYISTIFANLTSGDENLPSIVASAMQFVALLFFSFVIDKLGRRRLLMVSGFVMSLSTLVLGIYFYLNDNGTSMQGFTWLPLLCICCYLVFYSQGFAAIPWIIGELYSPQVKAVGMSTSYTLGWFLIFVVLKFFNQCTNDIGFYGVFWIFSGIVATGVVFIYFMLPETKNKSLEQIQVEIRENR